MYTDLIRNIKRNIFFLFSFFFLFSSEANAQCAMCRAVLQTEESGIPAEAVNDGIVYLMIIPYLLLFVGGFLIYRIMKNKKVKAGK